MAYSCGFLVSMSRVVTQTMSGCHLGVVSLKRWDGIYIYIHIDCLCQGFPYIMGSLESHIPVLYTRGMYGAYVITIREYP
jgi:hypothetical protein